MAGVAPAMIAHGRRLVIGLGNPDRGDDKAGRLVTRLLRDLAPPDVAILEQDGDAGSLLPLLHAEDTVWLVDAACSGAPPGTIHRLDCAAGHLPPPAATTSSHGLGVAEAIALARALGSLPSRCVLYAIEGSAFDPGQAISAPAEKAARAVARRIAAELVDS